MATLYHFLWRFIIYQLCLGLLNRFLHHDLGQVFILYSAIETGSIPIIHSFSGQFLVARTHRSLAKRRLVTLFWEVDVWRRNVACISIVIKFIIFVVVLLLI
jgi:hypothetical protein